ncbi:hypothetical protein B0H17DRAFT_1071610 [Mycena rosella]|uniref:RING-type domain-containing protein n=1 Tax=Mycena rosella TaxID=1033263 RepID=A0AAD7GFP8_MYCRO|nr:hypothetical protein B0H17DRAFT_1071610 [Mycena rosella]
MAWYHSQFTTRRFNPYTPNPVSLTTLPAADAAKKAPTPDSLFGPNIGPVEPGPAWTTHTQPKRLVEADELTTDTVRAWIEKSKIPTTATTTLQAQVNLRRPTLRLSPLAPEEGVNMKDAPHLLEFQFDCAAPQCGVHVHVLLPPSHPDAPPHGGALRVFEAVVPGGFARALGPVDAAVIELARFERMPPAASAAAASAPAPAAAAAAAPERKRFTPFHRRRAAPAATGAALAVVDAGDKKEGDAAAEDDSGVRITIRLIALDAAGRELDSPNEQTVYLVVGRLGAVATPAVTPAATAAAPAEGEAKKEGDNAEADDTRPWLVRVVKREATIGPHTFHLHEIYGLSSAAAAPPPAATSASYPPQPPADDPPERECLLCLSAPREVVLLPCRHLVACRPCALNMVEFGAGGVIVPEADAAEEAAPPAAAATTTIESPSPADADADGESPAESPAEGDAAEAPAESPAENAASPAAATPAAAPAAPTTTRRKRKAKGWFCPVCRQPYTSLLRITTAPPPAAPTPASPTAPAAPGAEEEGANAGGGGLLGGLSGLRPAFLRGLSRARPGDVESQL